MVDVNGSYLTLKNVAFLTYNKFKDKRDVIEALKTRYEDVISSPRRYAEINDLQSLVKILENRNELNAMNIQVLEHIYKVLQTNQDLLIQNHRKIIIQHNKQNSSWSNIAISDENVENHAHFSNINNQYERQTVPRTSDSAPPNDSMVYSHQRSGLSERVVTTISTQIGYNWDGLARFLKVQECHINAIKEDPSLRNNEAKARAMLQECQGRIDPEDIETELLNALELAERRDLRDKVQKLLRREYRQ